MRPHAAPSARPLTAAAAIVMGAVAVPAALATLARHRFDSPVPLAGVDLPWHWRWRAVAESLHQPLTDDALVDLVVRSCLVVAWSAWLVLGATIVVELAHQLRHGGLPAPHVRGVGWAQAAARWVVAGLIVVVPLSSPPTVGSATGPGGRHAPPLAEMALATLAGPGDAAPPERDGQRAGSRPGQPARPGPPAPDPDDERATSERIHEVRRGESVYSIAERLAGGDRARTVHVADAILDANLGRRMRGGATFTNPAYIEVGWELVVPSGVAGGPAAPPDPEHVVQPGETLSSIAEQRLGDDGAWDEIWATNAGRTMADGRRFDDPHLIIPGWRLDVPAPAPDEPPHGPVGPPERPASDGDGATDEPDTDTGPPSTTPDTDTGPSTTPDTDTGPTSTTPDTDVGPSTPSSAAADEHTAGGPTTSTTAPVGAGSGAASSGERPEPAAPRPPLRIEHAAFLAAGVLGLVAVRRRQRARTARAATRIPDPAPGAIAVERELRAVDPGERSMRVDVAVRAAAAELLVSGDAAGRDAVDAAPPQIGTVSVAPDGAIALRLTGASSLPAPWVGSAGDWHLPASVPIELLTDAARRVGAPCIALVHVGRTDDGRDVLIDLEAAGTLAVDAPAAIADEVVTALAATTASTELAEVAHLVTASLPPAALLGHRNVHVTDSVDAALELAAVLTGTTAEQERTTFDLRARRTGGEAWEPVVVFATSLDDAVGAGGVRDMARPGHGTALVAAVGPDAPALPDAARLAVVDGAWRLAAFGVEATVTPVGLGEDDVERLADLVASASAPLRPADLERGAEPTLDPAGDFTPREHRLIVRLLGAVDVVDCDGRAAEFERSKTTELIAWLATHRDRATRTAARTALWELDVRDATFANVVSEARRGMARLREPDDGEWLARTLNEQLPLHPAVVTDAELVHDRMERARSEPPARAIDILRPAVELVRDLPFSGTSYLWPDAEGITSRLVLLCTTVCAELGAHALSVGDVELVFDATDRGLRVLPGHEELIGLRMRAHARTGDLAGVRQEWEAYERVIVADPWSDGDPAPKLAALRQELLTGSPA